MREVADVVGHQRAADASVLGPSVHARVDEGAVDDQLAPAVEEVEQAQRALGPLELIGLVHRRPRHPPAHRRQRIARPGELFLLDEHFLERGLPLLRRHDRRRLHRLLYVFKRSTFRLNIFSPAHHERPL